MSAQPVVLMPDQYEPALNVVGTQVTVLASNAAVLMPKQLLTFHTAMEASSKFPPVAPNAS